MDSWVIQPILSPTLIIAILAALVGLLLFVPAFGNLSAARKRRLVLIRLLVILMAGLALVRPGCVQKSKKNQSAVVLVLFDVSRSMELPHVSDQSTRWAKLKEMLDENQELFRKLQDSKIEIRFFGFDNQLTPFEMTDGKIVIPEQPEGTETDIGTAVYKTSQEVRDERLVGVYLISDGVQNALDPEVELTRAADSLADMQVPLYTITMGVAGNDGQIADVAIKNLQEEYRVRVKNRFRAKATVVARGYANQKINVQLMVTNRLGAWDVVGPPVIVEPKKSYEEIQVEMEYAPPEVGEFRMKIRAQPQPGELALRNNELPSFLTVAEGGMRVLYIEGNLGWEQREVQRAIRKAAQGIDVEFITIFSNNRSRWPYGAQITERIKDPAVDVFILGDIDSRALYHPIRQKENLEALKEAVKKGKGLMMLGGYHSFGPGRYQKTPLADILPIRMDPNASQEFGENVRRDLHIDRRIGLKPVRDHYVTRLNTSEDRFGIWKKLPKLLGANKFTEVKPNALVLLESDDSAASPILVAGNVGGRVLCFAGDSTWRWKWHGFEDEFNAFWRQAIFWLAFWDGKNDGSVYINLPQRRFPPRSLVSAMLGARDRLGNEIPNADFDVKLIGPDGDETPLQTNRTSEGVKLKMETRLIAKSGLYKIKVAGSQNGQSIGETQRDFIVIDRDKEKSNPAADPEQMLRLANQTKEFGGKAISPSGLTQQLQNLLDNPPETEIEIPTRWKLGESLPDASAYLVIFVGLLAFEWICRKRWGLV